MQGRTRPCTPSSCRPSFGSWTDHGHDALAHGRGLRPMRGASRTRRWRLSAHLARPVQEALLDTKALAGGHIALCPAELRSWLSAWTSRWTWVRSLRLCTRGPAGTHGRLLRRGYREVSLRPVARKARCLGCPAATGRAAKSHFAVRPLHAEHGGASVEPDAHRRTGHENADTNRTSFNRAAGKPRSVVAGVVLNHWTNSHTRSISLRHPVSPSHATASIRVTEIDLRWCD